MGHDVDSVLHEYLMLKDEVEFLKDQLAWGTRADRGAHPSSPLGRSVAPCGAQATAIHERLDRVLEAAVRVRDVGRTRCFPVDSPSGEDEPPSYPTSLLETVDGCYWRPRQAVDLLGRSRTKVQRSTPSRVPPRIRTDNRPSSHGSDSSRCTVAIRQRRQFDTVHRTIRSGGTLALRRLLEMRHREEIAAGRVSPAGLAIHRGAVIIDVTHRANTTFTRASSVSSVRPCRVGPTITVRCSSSGMVTARCSVSSAMSRPFASASGGDTFPSRREVNQSCGTSVRRPIQSWFRGTPPFCFQSRLTVAVLGDVAAIRSGVVRRFGAIGFDLVPLTSAETVHHGMVAAFPSHISVMKYADRISDQRHRGEGVSWAVARFGGAGSARSRCASTPVATYASCAR